MRQAIILCCALSVPAAWAYPLDGAASTGIRRLTGYRLVNEGKIKGAVKLPPGAMLRSDQVVLHLKGVNPGFDITSSTPQDAALKGGLDHIFGGRDASYAVAILDISDPQKPRYAAVRGDDKKIPG